MVPLDAMKGEAARRTSKRLAKAIESFFYSASPPSVTSFLRAHPDLRLVVETEAWLRLAHGLRLEDVHDQQLGYTQRASRLHAVGSLVLYDGQAT